MNRIIICFRIAQPFLHSNARILRRTQLIHHPTLLADTPHEDLLCVLYDVFDFLATALEGDPDNQGVPPGRVLVHCSQGVSRSASLAIAWRMWRERRAFADVFAEVKSLRGVASPNIGFVAQLREWAKRLGLPAGADTPAAAPPPRALLFRLAPQSPAAPAYLVPKLPKAHAEPPPALDPRGVFVLHAPGADEPALFLWVGAAAAPALAAAARRFAGQLARYEGAPAAAEVTQGAEPAAFAASLALVEPRVEPAPREVPLYGREYALLAAAEAAGAGGAGAGSPAGSPATAAAAAATPTPRSDTGSGADTARSGRKTPRAPADSLASPNDRLRKAPRSEVGGSDAPLVSARARALEFERDALRQRALGAPASARRHEGAPPRPPSAERAPRGRPAGVPALSPAAPRAPPAAEGAASARPPVPRLSLSR